MKYAVLFLLPVLAVAGEWYIETIDATNGTYGTSLALDDSGYPHIAYNSGGGTSYLISALWDGYRWRHDTVFTGMYLSNASLELDRFNYPHIAFNEEGYYIVYVYWDGLEWHEEYIDFFESGMDYLGPPSLALDSSDYPHVTYCYDDWDYVCFMIHNYWDGSNWHRIVVDRGDDSCDSSLAIDNLDYPHVSYSMDDALQYARWNGTAWLKDNVELFSVGITSIALTSSQYPVISYSDIFNGYMKCVRWDGVKWLIDTVDSGVGQQDCYTSLALDSLDYPHISYRDYSNNDLKYAWWDGDIWQKEIVDPEGGWYISLELDEDNYPHISYEHEDNKILYAHYVPYGFHLLSPEKGEVLDTPEALLDWGDSADPDHDSYTLWWSTDEDYEDYTVITGIDDSEYLLTEGIEEGDRVYWRVKSIGDGDECCAAEMDWYFDIYEEPAFHLQEPEKGAVVDTLTPSLDWGDSPFPGHESYTLWWGSDPDFETYNEVTGIEESEYTIPSGIEDGDRIYWRVKSIDDEEGEYWAAELDWYFDVDLGVGVDIVDFGADATDEGVLVDWRCEGGEPAGVRVLRGDVEPVTISGLMPGASARYLDRGVEPGGSYVYWLEITEADGTVSRFGPTEAVSIPEETFALVLYAAYPSPSRDAVNFSYSIPADGRVVLAVYDLSGRRIATPVDADEAAGRHDVAWSCGDVPSGVYLYRLETNAGSLTRRLVVSR